MKKAIYIWAICMVGLLFSTQGFAQRGHGNNAKKGNPHHQGRSFKGQQRTVKKGKAIARYHNPKNNHPRRPIVTRRPPAHHYSGPSYHRAPVRRPVYRAVPWAARRHYNFNRHVYFPDYHAFYDARRRGYVYRNGGRWIFTRTVPSFMVGINWNNVRLQYLQGVPVDVYPQTYYDTYVNRYPAVSLNLNVHL